MPNEGIVRVWKRVLEEQGDHMFFVKKSPKI
jgi:hypothetical protein